MFNIRNIRSENSTRDSSVYLYEAAFVCEGLTFCSGTTGTESDMKLRGRKKMLQSLFILVWPVFICLRTVMRRKCILSMPLANAELKGGSLMESCMT